MINRGGMNQERTVTEICADGAALKLQRLEQYRTKKNRDIYELNKQYYFQWIFNIALVQSGLSPINSHGENIY
jgi:hypothetical protein